MVLSGKRVLLFRLICISLPFLVIGLVESILRLAGLGGYAPIVRPVGETEHGTLVITDPAGAATWFFANRERPGYNEQYSFYQPKSPGTIRVVLVGESAMKGFPQPRHLAASAFFREMLKDVWPDRNIEVINLGTTAVASFPVLGIMTEALDYEPDLVIVSTGHNEFFGTYGVASIGWAGSRPWMLRLTRFVHSLALVQGVDKLFPGRGKQENKTLMEIMIGQGHVPLNDWRRAAAARNLESNVATMIERCRARGVPVIVCTQPSNERDLAPVGGGTEATEEFRVGRALFAGEKYGEALQHFIRARDLDPMPWRTPSSSQQAILRAASRQGALICDLEKVFRDASPGGAIGWELMDDHVHPTLQGQWLMARAWVECLTQLSGPLHVSRQEYLQLGNAEEYARRLGDNPFDRYAVAHTMRVIFNIPFMRETNPQAYARFNELATRIETNYPPAIQAVMREYQTAVPHAGGKRPITGMVARVLIREGKFAEALALLRIAQRAVPDYTSWHMEYVYFALACREKLDGGLSAEDKALALEEIKQGRFLLQHGYSESGLAERYIGRLHQLRGEYTEAIPYLLACRKKLSGTDLVAADQALVVSYLKTGHLEEADRIVDNGIAHSGVYASFYRRMRAELEAMKRNAGNGQQAGGEIKD